MVQKKLPIILFGLAILLSQNVFSQGYWEPQTNITGYISTEFNYFDKIDTYDVNYGTSITEAGFLINYKPASNFTLKSVFVYRPGFSFDQMLNEANGQLSLSDYVNFKVGRFLLPLSPMNTYYYAPVNTSATLPILITNHEFFALNMDGVSLNGSVGEDIKFNYDVFAGGFRSTLWLKTGALGFFGDEPAYFQGKMGSLYTVDPSFNNNYQVAIGGAVSVSYESMVTLGFSAYNPKDYSVPLGVNFPANYFYDGSPATYQVVESHFKKFVYGANIKVQVGETKLIGEYWDSDLSSSTEALGTTDTPIDLNGAFVELSHRIDKVTPYVRYEDQTTNDLEYTRLTIGANYKPSFTRTVKAEYLMYDHVSGNINGFVATLIYSF